MNMFSGLQTEGLEQSQDVLGGFSAFESDIYLASVKMAYAGAARSGAKFLTLIFDVDNKEYRETIYVTNKNGDNFYLNKNDNTKKVPLPGFTTVNDLAMVTVDKPLSELKFEEKVVKIYDYEEKKEVPTAVQVATELLGKQVYIGTIKEIVDQTKEVNGEYIPTGKTREVNVINKIFHYPSKITVVEAVNNIAEPAFYDAWLERNKGVTRDRTEKTDASANSGTNRRRSSSGSTGGSEDDRPKKRLFGG